MRNVKIAYVLSFISEFYFPVSIWLFYYLNFLDFKQIGILIAIRVVASNFLEIPTGVFADIFGRKLSVFLAFSIYAFVMFALANVSGFWIFVLLEIGIALSHAFSSGSLEALVYDSLKQKDQENRYDKVVSNMSSFSWIGLFLASIIGGYLYYWQIKSPYILQGIMYVFASVISLFLIEPKINSQKYSLTEMIAFNFIGFKELFKNSKMSQLSLVLITLGAAYMIASEMLGISQAKEYGMDSRSVGFLFAGGYLIAALSSQFYPKLKKIFGEKVLIILIASILISSFLLAKWVTVLVGAFLIIMRISSSTTFSNLSSSIINRHIDSKSRATTLSSLALLTKLPLAVTAYFIGAYIDKSSPNNLAWIIGLSIIALLIVQSMVFGFVKRSSVKI